MYERILVPLDGSKRAEKILSQLEQMAQCFETKLYLLRVVAPVYYVLDPNVSYVEVDQDRTKYEMAEATTYLETLKAELQSKNIKVEIFVEQGGVVETLIAFARKHDMNLIALASHGRTGLARVFYGSVAAAILQQVDRPILVIRSKDEE